MTALASGAACASGLSLLELDAASVGPLLLSRPFAVGPLVGGACGDVRTGTILGVLFEVLTLEELPLGGRLELSAPVAAGVAAWLAAGPAVVPAEAAFLCGLAAGWAHARVERFLRARRARAPRRAEAALDAGRPPRLGAELAGALGLQAAATFAVSAAAFALAAPLAPRAWALAPEAVRAGARFAYEAAPWLAGGALVASLWRGA